MMFNLFIITLKIASVIISITIFFCLYRAILGPTIPDRIIGINVVGTKVTVMFVFVGAIFNQVFFFDIALVYVLLLFVTTLAIVKYMEFQRIDK